MKKTNLYLLLAVGAVGVLAFSAKIATANDAATTTSGMLCPSMSCCGGLAAATPVADTNKETVPDQLKTCPVSGEKLGEMGKPNVFIYKGQEVKLCCPGCRKDFDKDPEKFIKLVRAADKKN